MIDVVLCRIKTKNLPLTLHLMFLLGVLAKGTA